MDIFILGAGFSYAVSKAMPLLPELSRRVARRAEEDPLISEPPSETHSENIEEWLTYLSADHPWLAEEESLRNRATYLRLSRLLAVELSAAENEAVAIPPPTWALQLAYRWHVDRALVISLNYDTLVEKLTHEVSWQQSVGRATPTSMYPVAIPSVSSRLPGRGMTFGEARVEETLTLAKLHGSLSWRYSGAESFYGETVFRSGDEMRWRPKDLKEQDRHAADKVPLVVPPTFHKNTFFNNETIRTVWRKVRELASFSDVIYCIGYSLPPSDLMVRSFLRDLSPKRIVVVDVDKRVSERYRQQLAPIAIDDSFVTERGAEAFAARYANDVELPTGINIEGLCS